MHLGILTLYLSIGGADSLKDKRQAIRSLTARLWERFNVSAAEVGELDVWRRAVVGVAIVTNDPRFANQVLSQVVNHTENDPRALLEDYTIEILAVGEGDVPSLSDDEPDVSDWFTDKGR